MWKLLCKSAWFATEFCIVFRCTIFGFDDKITICKEYVIFTIRWNKNIDCLSDIDFRMASQRWSFISSVLLAFIHAVVFKNEIIFVSTASTVVELSTSVFFRIEIPTSLIVLTSANFSSFVASILGWKNQKNVRITLKLLYWMHPINLYNVDIVIHTPLMFHNDSHCHRSQYNRKACTCYRSVRNTSELF